MSQLRNKTKTPAFLPNIHNSNFKQTTSHLSLKRITLDKSQQIKKQKDKDSIKKEKIISHFLIRYLERKQNLQEKQFSKSIVHQQRKSECSISSNFRRGYLKLRHAPHKPLQTRFLIANHESISFV